MAIQQPAHQQILGLDMIRFICALMVAVFHLTFWVGVAPIAGDGHPVMIEARGFGTTAWFGWIGVEVFFVLSGFVIAYSAQNRSAYQFAKSRVLRLFPTVWICACTTSLVLFLFSGFHPHEIFNKLMHTVVIHPYGPSIDIVYWTLSIEVSFYIMIFFVIRLLGFSRIEQYAFALMIFSGLSWIADAIFYILGYKSQAVAIAALMSRQKFRLLLWEHGCYFALGIYLWAIFSRGAEYRRCTCAIFCIAGCLCEIFFRARIQEGVPHPNAMVPMVAWAILVGLVATSVALDSKAHAIFGYKNSAIRLAGLVTFPLYLLHDAIGISIVRILMALGVAISASVVISIIICIIISGIIVIYIEPVLRIHLGKIFKYYDRRAAMT